MFLCESDEKTKIFQKIDEKLSEETSGDGQVESLKKYFTQNMISFVLKILCLKKMLLGSQELRHCKLGHALETALIDNLMQDSSNKSAIHKIHRILDLGLVQMKSVSLKKQAIKTSIDFVCCFSDENRRVGLCSVECKSILVCHTLQREMTRMTALDVKYAIMKWDDPLLHECIPRFHEKVQLLYHSTICDFDKILFLVGK